MGLDVKVLREDQTEVEIMETIDCSETDLHAIIEGDEGRPGDKDESFSDMGYTEQEFDGEELVDIEEDEPDDEDYDMELMDFDETLDEE